MDPTTLVLGLAQFAPSILRFFGAGEKSAAIADQVVQIAQSVTGAASPQDALDKLRADAQLAQQFNLAVLAADTDLEKAFLADRADARKRDTALHQAGYQNRRADLMVLLDVVGLVACLVAIVWLRKDMSGEAITLITTLASYFGLSLRDAHQFEFGSSRGSRDKDAILGKVAS